MTTNDHPGNRSKRSKSPSSAFEPAQKLELLALTVDAKTGRLVKLEGIDSGGARHELSEVQRARLAQEKGEDTLEALIEEAFEAGIASVLGDGAGQFAAGESEESEEEAELRYLLLKPLIERSPARHLLRRDTLTRATLGTLLRQGIGPGPQGAASKSSRPSPKGSTSKPQQPSQAS